MNHNTELENVQHCNTDLAQSWRRRPPPVSVDSPPAGRTDMVARSVAVPVPVGVDVGQSGEVSPAGQRIRFDSGVSFSSSVESLDLDGEAQSPPCVEPLNDTDFVDV